MAINSRFLILSLGTFHFSNKDGSGLLICFPGLSCFIQYGFLLLFFSFYMAPLHNLFLNKINKMKILSKIRNIPLFSLCLSLLNFYIDIYDILHSITSGINAGWLEKHWQNMPFSKHKIDVCLSFNMWMRGNKTLRITIFISILIVNLTLFN